MNIIDTKVVIRFKNAHVVLIIHYILYLYCQFEDMIFQSSQNGIKVATYLKIVSKFQFRSSILSGRGNFLSKLKSKVTDNFISGSWGGEYSC